MKVLSTKVDGEIEQKFKAKIEKDGLDASDVLRRLVNAYVGESETPLKPLASAVEVDGHLSQIEARLRTVEQKITTDTDPQNPESTTGKCETLIGCITNLQDTAELTTEKIKDIAEILSEIDTKFKVTGKLIESVGNGLMLVNDRLRWCEDDIKGFKRLGIEPKPETLEHMIKSQA